MSDFLAGWTRVRVAWWRRALHGITRGRLGDDGLRPPAPTHAWVTMIGGGGGGGSSRAIPANEPLELEPGRNYIVTVGGARPDEKGNP